MPKEYFTDEVCPACGKATLHVRWVDIQTDQVLVEKRLSERCTNPKCESNDPNVTAFDVVKRATEGR